MKKAVILALLGAGIFCAPAHAQVTFDMSRVTCADYLAMSPATSRDFSAWMSGWFNQQSGNSTLNVEGYRRNVASVQKWCAANANRNQLVMSGLKASVPNARPGQPGPTDIDASLITCGQFLKASAEKQSLVGSWMSGWFMSTKNLTSVDNRYVERNIRVVGTYCKRNKDQKLMAAIEKNFR